VLCQQFQVDTGGFAVSGLVLDTKVGNGDFASHDLEAMPGSDLVAGFGAKSDEFPIEVFLEFEVENTRGFLPP